MMCGSFVVDGQLAGASSKFKPRIDILVFDRREYAFLRITLRQRTQDLATPH